MKARAWLIGHNTHGRIITTLATTALLFCILVIALALYSFSRDESLSRLQESSTIRIGYAVEAPYAFLNPDGEVTGESPEIARRVTQQLGNCQIVSNFEQSPTTEPSSGAYRS